MNGQNLKPIGAAGPRVDGIDTAQLLRDLGEASAAGSVIDLFDLCLRAQRVLTSLDLGGLGTSPDEFALLAAFRTMDDSARSEMLPVMQAIAEKFPKRPMTTLALVRPTSFNR